ncbi:response regulator [Aquiflexum sp.]|uniref:Hpt domain-containing response regulator n=1 Tax=Aquiflexum sp. TaxID=1872584 RepID=UPI003593DCDA
MNSKKVLIVDDNALNRRVFEHIIGQLYLFETAENGKVALEKLKEGKFDLILMDIQMTVLDGINTLKIIKNEQICLCPVIAVSAYANESDRDYFLATGFDDFIPKPIKPKLLLECIDKHIRKNDPVPESNTEQDTEPELNLKVVKQLLRFNTAENIRSVYDEFVEESMQILSEMESLISKEQFAEIGEKIHIIKGNSGTLGALKVYIFCQKFEKDIKSLNFENTLEEFLYLKTLIQSFKSKIQTSQLLNP